MLHYIELIKKRGTVVLLLTLYVITTSMALNHADTTLSTPLLHLVFVSIKSLALYLAILLFVINKHKSIDPNALLYVLPYILYLIVAGIFSFDGILGFGLFAAISNEKKYLCFVTFRDYLVLSSFLGIIAYLSFVIGIPLPHTTVPLYGGSMGSYINFGFTYLDFSFDGLRLCGLFNEPGYFGTILALTLIASGFNMKKISNIVMLIAGILTASMAFFILVGLYVFFVNIYKPKRLITILLVFFVSSFVLIKTGIVPQTLVDHILGRFVFEDGKFVGDNRSSTAIDDAFTNMLKSSKVWFGYGDHLPVDQESTLTYKFYVLQYGIIGALLTWGVLLFASLKTSKCSLPVLTFIALFFISIYQRPGIFVPCYFVVLFGGVLYQNKLNSYES